MAASWRVSTDEGVNLSPDELVGLLAAHHGRLIDNWTGLTDEQWSCPSRNARWTVHETVRHVADAMEATAAGVADRESRFSVDGFDARTTPIGWLAGSAGESPSRTIERFAAAAETTRDLTGRRLAAADASIRAMVYGPVHWSVGVVHAFWDSWVHERDVMLPLGLPANSTVDEARLAGMYGLLMATLPARMMEQPFTVEVRLAGPDRVVAAAHDRGRCAGWETDATAADLAGEVGRVVDALCGRGDPIAEVLPGSPALLSAFGAHMASEPG